MTTDTTPDIDPTAIDWSKFDANDASLDEVLAADVGALREANLERMRREADRPRTYLVVELLRIRMKADSAEYHIAECQDAINRDRAALRGFEHERLNLADAIGALDAEDQ